MKSLNWQGILFTLFTLTIMATGTLWFLSNYELKEIDEYAGYRGEARTNDLFAARLFIKRMGIGAQAQEGIASLPGTDTVIVLDTQRYTFSKEKTEELLAWVQRGGHLLTRARVDLETSDDASTDTEQASVEGRDWLQQLLGIEIGKHVLVDEDDLPFPVKLVTAPQALDVELDFFNSLLVKDKTRHTTEYRFGENTWLLQTEYGAGLVTLAASLDFIENQSIDHAEHASLLWYLLHSHNPQFKDVLLIHKDTLPSLFSLLLAHAWALLAMAGLTLLFVFWALIPRFGALIPEPIPERRRIGEHIKASGQFLWKQPANGREQLIHSTHLALQQNARQHIPGWAGLTLSQQASALGTYLQLPPEQHAALESLLADTTANPVNSARRPDEAYFVRLVKLANRLRKIT